MLAALRQAGWGNYSLFLTGDGLLVGYLETDDYQAALARMAGTEVNQRWQEDMAPYFAELSGRRPMKASGGSPRFSTWTDFGQRPGTATSVRKRLEVEMNRKCAT